jgi:hypothetical protein
VFGLDCVLGYDTAKSGKNHNPEGSNSNRHVGERLKSQKNLKIPKKENEEMMMMMMMMMKI